MYDKYKDMISPWAGGSYKKSIEIAETLGMHTPRPDYKLSPKVECYLETKNELKKYKEFLDSIPDNEKDTPLNKSCQDYYDKSERRYEAQNRVIEIENEINKLESKKSDLLMQSYSPSISCDYLKGKTRKQIDKIEKEIKFQKMTLESTQRTAKNGSPW